MLVVMEQPALPVTLRIFNKALFAFALPESIMMVAASLVKVRNPFKVEL